MVVNLGYFYNSECVMYEGYTYYDYYTGESYYYGAPQGVFSVNADGTFTHSFCYGDEVGSWTSDGNTIDITLLCGQDYYGYGDNSYSFIGTLVDGQITGSYSYDYDSGWGENC